MTAVLDRPRLQPANRQSARRRLAVCLFALGIAGSLNVGTWLHDLTGVDQPLIVHGVQSR